MTTFWIVLVCVVYVLGWLTAARLIHRYDDTMGDEWGWVVAMSTIWPFLVLLGVPVGIGYGMYRLATAPMPSITWPKLRRRPDDEWIQDTERELGIGD